MVAGVVAVVALAAGCVDDEVEPLPAPPPLPSTSSSLPPVDLSNVPLPTVPGRTTTTLPPIVGGKATLAGVVVGPDGPVQGAVVHLERLVGDTVSAIDLTTGEGGGWIAKGIYGGRYRVRAWKPAPDNLAATQSEVFFLGGDERRELNIRVQRFQGLSVGSDIAPDPPTVDQRAALVVQLTELSVDAGGIVRSVPVAQVPVELFGPGRWRVLTANPALTGPDGRVRWELRCEAAGEQPLSVLLPNGQVFAIDAPTCVAPRPVTTTTTTVDGDDDETPTSSTTTTTRRGNRPTTTTTR